MLHHVRRLFRYMRSRRYRYERLVHISISKGSLLHNLTYFRKLKQGLQVAPVLKSNAYGHGLIETARVFDREGLPFLVVDAYFEALILRNEGIQTPILIIGYTSLNNILKNKRKHLIFSILDLEQLKDLSRELSRPATFHLKIDTGMHRQGLVPEQLEPAIRLLQQNPNMRLDGLLSHLSDASNPDPSYSKQQIHTWNHWANRFREAFPEITYLHLAATGGAIHHEIIDANVMRIGLGLYGYGYNADQKKSLRPVMQIETHVAAVKRVPAGSYIGYSLSYLTEEDITIALIPCGYNACVDRRLSNKGFFYIQDIPCPILGKVSMNITMIDVSKAGPVKKGDRVEMIGRIVGRQNSISSIAALCETNACDVLVSISPMLKRVVYP